MGLKTIAPDDLRRLSQDPGIGYSNVRAMSGGNHPLARGEAAHGIRTIDAVTSGLVHITPAT